MSRNHQSTKNTNVTNKTPLARVGIHRFVFFVSFVDPDLGLF
jgi:hypothetical protein